MDEQWETKPSVYRGPAKFNWMRTYFWYVQVGTRVYRCHSWIFAMRLAEKIVMEVSRG